MKKIIETSGEIAKTLTYFTYMYEKTGKQEYKDGLDKACKIMIDNMGKPLMQRILEKKLDK